MKIEESNMLKKITFRTILFMAVLLLIVPVIISAAGNREAENGKGMTSDQEVLDILERIEFEDLSIEDAKAEFMSLDKEFQFSEEERVTVQKMMDEVKLGVIKSEDCKDQLQDQLKTRERIKEQTQEGTAVKEQSQISNSAGQGNSENNSTGTSSSSNSSGSSSKGKK